MSRATQTQVTHTPSLELTACDEAAAFSSEAMTW
jgi:hypothetical protein